MRIRLVENLLNENLKEHTPYMLNKHGELLECGNQHPYIRYNLYNKLDDVIKDFSDKHSLEWFYNNTENTIVQYDIEVILNSLYKMNLVPETYVSSIKPRTNDFIEDESNLWRLINTLNDITNREFCRVRTSDLLFGGTGKDTFFRICPRQYNWFNVIWNVVYANRNFISSVTISTDSASTGNRLEYYKHNGKSIYLMPTDDFINLSGNPIIEELLLDEE